MIESSRKSELLNCKYKLNKSVTYPQDEDEYSEHFDDNSDKNHTEYDDKM